MTAMLTEKFKARPVKIFGKNRELRCWEVPIAAVKAWENSDEEFYHESSREHFDKELKKGVNAF